MIISLILACDENNAIGFQNKLLCHLPNDLKFFKQTTSGHCILMGRKTFESIGKPLPNRTNLVLTHDLSYSGNGIAVFHDVEAAIEYAQTLQESELMVIGGGQLYELMMAQATRIYLTRIHAKFEADTYFNELPPEWRLISKSEFEADETNLFAHSMLVYEKRF